MTPLADTVAELKRFVAHGEDLSRRGLEVQDLESDLTLSNDVLFTLVRVAQGVIDIAAELSARRGLRYADYTEAVDNLAAMGYPPELVRSLRRLPSFRNIVLHEYVHLELARALEALTQLALVRELLQLVSRRLLEEGEE